MADIHVTGTGYPTTLDTATTLSNDTVAGDGTGSAINAAHQNGPAGAIIAIETALGTTPQGTTTDVKTRLAVGLSGTGQLLLGTASACAAALLASKGGTGIDTSASTGVASVSSGTWSILAKLTAALGGTAIDTSASTGIPQVAAGTWSVPAQVAASKGGTGLDTSASTGTPNIAAGAWSIVTDTGSGNNVRATSPTLVTPVLGTPSSGNLANCTGYPVTETGTWGVGILTTINTVYQNTSGRKRRISLGLTAVAGAAASSCFLKVENANPPTVSITEFGIGAGASVNASGQIYAEIPNGWFYELTSSSGTINIDQTKQLDE